MGELREHITSKYFESPFIATIIEITKDTKPVKVRRMYEGKTYEFRCYITTNVKEKLLAKQIILGDKVVVMFIEAKGEKPIILGKVAGI